MNELMQLLGNTKEFQFILFIIILFLIINIWIKISLYNAIINITQIEKDIAHRNELEYEKIRLLRELVNTLQQNATCDNLRHCDK